MTTPTYPMVNLGNRYIQDLQISFVDTTHIGVAPGEARCSKNINDITLLQNAALAGNLGVSINVRAKGAGGLDTGVLAANTFYYVFVIGDSTKYQPTTALISLSSTAPTLPSGFPVGGYDMFRRIGTILTDGTAAPNTLVLPFLQDSNGLDRKFWYSTPIVILAATAAAAYTALGAAALGLAVPPISTDVTFQADLLPNAPAAFVRLRYTGSTAALGQSEMSGDVAAVHHFDNMVCPCNATPSIDYITDAVSTVQLSVVAYIDRL